jgi:hypothetical protein
MWRAGIYDHTEPGMTITATANATGIAQGFLGPVPAGYCWYLERWTTFSSGGTSSSLLGLYVLTTNAMPAQFSATFGDRAGRQDLSLSAANDAADLNSPIYIPEGYYLVAFWTGFNSADVAQLSTQVAVHLVGTSRTEPRQLEVQQAEHATPDINEEEVIVEEGIIAELEHATADLMRGAGKAV